MGAVADGLIKDEVFAKDTEYVPNFVWKVTQGNELLQIDVLVDANVYMLVKNTLFGLNYRMVTGELQ